MANRRLSTARLWFFGVERSVFLQTRSFFLSYLDKKVNRKFSLPLNVSEPGGVPESFGKRVAIYFQLGYLERNEWATRQYHFRGLSLFIFHDTPRKLNVSQDRGKGGK